jgi:hypothetical protein
MTRSVDPVLEKTLSTELEEPARLFIRNSDGTVSETACSTLREAVERALGAAFAQTREGCWVESVTGEILTLEQLEDVADRFRS